MKAITRKNIRIGQVFRAIAAFEIGNKGKPNTQITVGTEFMLVKSSTTLMSLAQLDPESMHPVASVSVPFDTVLFAPTQRNLLDERGFTVGALLRLPNGKQFQNFQITGFDHEKVHLVNLDSSKTLSVNIMAVLPTMQPTGEIKPVAAQTATSEIKFTRGMVLALKAALPDAPMPDGSKTTIPAGTKAAVIKAGANIELMFDHKVHENFASLIINKAYAAELLTPSEAVTDPLLQGFSINAFKSRQGRTDACFSFNLLLNGKKVGMVENSGNGGCSRIHVESPQAKEKIDQLMQQTEIDRATFSDRFATYFHEQFYQLMPFKKFVETF